ncbi:MAG TPA: hypothetical protein VFA20_29605 [Myxococcaceae bacterium]|nr:hypothetical protein [Myxococcaceae bacterium]
MRALLVILAMSAVSACGGGGHGPPDGGTDGGDRPPCVTNPTTHLELINACTTAQQIEKNPVLPLLLPDGGLPPLQ